MTIDVTLKRLQGEDNELISVSLRIGELVGLVLHMIGFMRERVDVGFVYVLHCWNYA